MNLVLPLATPAFPDSSPKVVLFKLEFKIAVDAYRPECSGPAPAGLINEALKEVTAAVRVVMNRSASEVQIPMKLEGQHREFGQKGWRRNMTMNVDEEGKRGLGRRGDACRLHVSTCLCPQCYLRNNSPSFVVIRGLPGLFALVVGSYPHLGWTSWDGA